jgi:hypothetical protein
MNINGCQIINLRNCFCEAIIIDASAVGGTSYENGTMNGALRFALGKLQETMPWKTEVEKIIPAIFLKNLFNPINPGSDLLA